MSLKHKNKLSKARDAARDNPLDKLRDNRTKLGGITNEIITGKDGKRSVVMKDEKHNVFAYFDMQDDIPTLTAAQGDFIFKETDMEIMQEKLASSMKIALMISDDMIGNKDHQPVVFQDHPEMKSFYSNALRIAVQENNKSRAITNTFKKPANAA